MPAIALYYFIYLGALGLYWPFLSLYLRQLGLAPTEITLVQALAPLAGLIAPPLTGLLADARSARVWLLRGASLAAAIAFALFLRPHPGRLAIFVTFFVFAVARAPLTSLVDATALERVALRGGSYGALRLWGSIGFLVGAAGGGALFQGTGLWAMVVATTVALALASACAWAIPAPSPVARPHILRAWRELLAQREVWLLLGAVVLAQAGGGCYDACFSLHLAALGHGSGFVGAAWAIGVLAEVLLLAGSGAIIARVGAERLFFVSVATGALRWLILPRVASPLLLLALQPLHGVTFGTFWASGVILIGRRAGRAAASSAQGLLAAAYGAGSLLGMSAAGRLLERRGAVLLWSTASVSAALGALLALLLVRRASARAGHFATAS